MGIFYYHRKSNRKANPKSSIVIVNSQAEGVPLTNSIKTNRSQFSEVDLESHTSSLKKKEDMMLESVVTETPAPPPYETPSPLYVNQLNTMVQVPVEVVEVRKKSKEGKPPKSKKKNLEAVEIEAGTLSLAGPLSTSTGQISDSGSTVGVSSKEEEKKVKEESHSLKVPNSRKGSRQSASGGEGSDDDEQKEEKKKKRKKSSDGEVKSKKGKEKLKVPEMEIEILMDGEGTNNQVLLSTPEP